MGECLWVSVYVYMYIHIQSYCCCNCVLCALLMTVYFILSALAVYSCSPAAYEALKSFKLVQLPSVRTLKYYVDANLESIGIQHPE